ncbi:hypothetical protein BLNAU_5707 [Blattamonas nauphoetae]|uniref:SH3 domain-containing protein n=1 Tax=Blattamonas nauphoetae TaxID=2049346 RepID=A0ABQ9Y6K0_9EUKA|nr:hypothetical protein BLNAU_5707 [Blattamonas nauphoetae]
MSTTYQSSPDLDFQDNFWDDVPIIFQRGHHGSEAFHQVAFRCTKNQLATTSFNEEIKSRKFDQLPEKGTLGQAWDNMKKTVEDIENITKAVSICFEELNKQIMHEKEEYDKACKQFELDFNAIKKKRADHFALVDKKKHSYEAAFKDWDKTEAEHQKAKTGGDQKALQKLSKSASAKTTAKNQTEADYMKAVQECNAVEDEYDSVVTHVLLSFEEIEVKRGNLMKDKLTAFWREWTNYQTAMVKCTQRGLDAAQTIAPHSDLAAFVSENKRASVLLPRKSFHACRREYGSSLSDSMSSLPPSVTSTPVHQPSSLPSTPVQQPSSLPSTPVQPPPRASQSLPSPFGRKSLPHTGLPSPVVLSTPIASRSPIAASQPSASPPLSKVVKSKSPTPPTTATPTTATTTTDTSTTALPTSIPHTTPSTATPQKASSPKETPETVVVAAYDFTAQAANEASISGGDELTVLKKDSGKGWTLIQKKDKSTGFVPTTHILTLPLEEYEALLREMASASSADPSLPPPPPDPPSDTSQLAASALNDFTTQAENHL